MVLVFIIVGLLFFIMGYGLYLTIGPGKKDLRDPIDEHAKMHELGIAHGHGGNKGAYEMSGKLNHNHEDWNTRSNEDVVFGKMELATSSKTL